MLEIYKYPNKEKVYEAPDIESVVYYLTGKQTLEGGWINRRNLTLKFDDGSFYMAYRGIHQV